MVQPASQYSCILEPAFAWGTALCQPVYDLANKISAFVSSIFTAIGEFVRSWVCCGSVAPVQNSPASYVTVPFPEVAPPATSTLAPRVEATLQETKTLLRTFANRFCESRQTTRAFLDEAMSTPEKAEEFFIRLVGYVCVMEPSLADTNQLVENLNEDGVGRLLPAYISDLRGTWRDNVSSWDAAVLRERFIRNDEFDISANNGPEGFMRLGNNLVLWVKANSPFFGFCADNLREDYLRGRQTLAQ